MISWSTKRRLLYTSITIGIFAILLGSYLFAKVYEPPTCFDNRQNQDELGIDCGGGCRYLCAHQVTNPTVLFSRSFEVTNGVYNAIAYVENPNFNSAVERVHYVFKLFDENNTLIAERGGVTYLTPGNISPIFENTILTNGIVPARTFFEFIEEPKWRRVAIPDESPLTIKQRTLHDVNASPRLDATIQNNTVFEIQDIEVVAVIFNALGNAIATSRTFVDNLPRRSDANLVFTWPQPFTKELEACIAPVDTMLLIDVSGSMNDDGLDPPQPLTDAKLAAEDFVGRLTEIDRSGLITFATHSRINQALTSEHSASKSAVSLLAIEPAEETGSTNIGDAIFDVLSILSEAAKENRTRSGKQARQIAVLLTDGKANAPENPGGEPHAELAAAQLKKAGITLYTIGLGDRVNTSFLAAIAESPNHYYGAASSDELDSIYRQISDAICERGAAIIEVKARSPHIYFNQ